MTEAIANEIIGGVRGFAADMQRQGIHVGLGSPPVCVTCDEPWPCLHESDPLVWQGMGGGEKYHREGCRMMRHGGVSWRRSFAAASPDEGLDLQPCKVCKP